MKIIVIGSGLLGVSTAYFLSQAGHEVVVLDRQDEPGKETSFANAGMVTPSQAEPWNHPGILKHVLTWLGKEDSPFLVRPGAIFSLLGWGIGFIRNSSVKRFHRNMRKNATLANHSLKILRDLRESFSIDYDKGTRGTLKIFGDERNFNEAIELAKIYPELGIQYRVLQSHQILDVEPSLAGSDFPMVGAIYYAGDESGDAFKFCQALAREAEKANTQFRYNVDVTGLEQEAGRLTRVNTSTGSVTADAYVLAAGSYSPLLARTVGLKLPVRPVKGYSLTLDLNGWENGPGMPVVDDTMHVAITPLGSRLRVAGTAELTGYNTEIQQSRIDNVVKFVSRIYPEFVPYMEVPLSCQWTGLRPYTSDGVPLLGATPFPNLYLNTGHGHLGWTMSTGSGQLIADLISKKKTAIDLAPYGLAR